MNKHRILGAAVTAALALAACGGSDGGPSAPAPAPAPTPTPTPTPPPPAQTVDRIEALDTARSPRGDSAKQAAAAASSRLPAGAAVAQVSLGPLRKTLVQQGQALQIGQGREVQATAAADALAGQWQWHRLADGAQVAAVRFSAEGAQAVRLGVLVQELPEGTVLRFYGADGAVQEMHAAELAALRAVNEAAGLRGEDARLVWGPDTAGAESTLEVQLPPGATPGQLKLAVPRLSHLTHTVAQADLPWRKDTTHIGAGGSCNIDVTCADQASQDSGRAVAKMVFSNSQGNSFVCTGTLLNDTRNSRTPYFLTAAHCISDQAMASSLLTYWFFRAASCGSAPRFDSQATRMSGGARLLYTRAKLDTTLLRLNGQPPANVVYAGSYFGPLVRPGIQVIGVHHPKGDLQKISLGEIQAYADCDAFDSQGNTACRLSANTGPMLVMQWSRGLVEQGSSGSAFFVAAQEDTSRRYVAGALSSGNGSCDKPDGVAVYGRFNLAFADGIRRWLAP